MLSLVPFPGCLFLDKAGNRGLARACNEYCRDLRQQYPDRFGFYVNLPNVYEDLEGSLEEIKYAFENLGAEGVCLFPQYGGFYLGHPQ
jgi:6-methylsalicylate decarboxylase